MLGQLLIVKWHWKTNNERWAAEVWSSFTHTAPEENVFYQWIYVGTPTESLINWNEIIPLAIRLHSSTQFPPQSQQEEDILRRRVLGSSILLELKKSKKNTFFVLSLSFGWLSAPGDMGLALVLWQYDTFSAGGLSDVALAKYCPPYLLHISPEPTSFQIWVSQRSYTKVTFVNKCQGLM